MTYRVKTEDREYAAPSYEFAELIRMGLEAVGEFAEILSEDEGTTSAAV